MQNSNDFSKRKKILAFVKLFLLLVVIVGIPLFLYVTYGDRIFSKDAAVRIISYLKANRNISALLIIIIQTIQVIICIIPGQPIQFAASYMFGIGMGYLLSLVGAVIGTIISFYIAKLLGKDSIRLLFGDERVDDYHRKINSGKGLLIVGLIYLIPGFPKDLVSYVAGISEMKLRPFLIVSTIARSPGMLGSLLLGHFVENNNYGAIAVLAVVVAIVLVISFIKRKELVALLDNLEEKAS